MKFKAYTYMYHPDGQFARANYGGKSEEFLWDGLALIRRGDEQFINEPHVGNVPKKLRFEGKPRAQRSARRARKGPRGNPVAFSKGTSYFNDALGTTVGAKKDGKYSAAALTAFGERLDNADGTSPAIRSLGEGWFTGKPFVEGLGHTFLMRNYRAGLAKWQTADPMGYPDGWNQLAYCGNGASMGVDFLGGYTVINSFFDALNHYAYGVGEDAIIGTAVMMEAVATEGYKAVVEELEKQLSMSPYVQTQGPFVLRGSFQWEQGLILGRNTMFWSISVTWTSTTWTYDSDRRCWHRDLTGRGIMHLNTSDDWDFNVHEGDSFLRSIFGEMIPGAIAGLYSILVASNIGEEYHMEGDALFWQIITAHQVME